LRDRARFSGRKKKEKAAAAGGGFPGFEEREGLWPGMVPRFVGDSRVIRAGRRIAVAAPATVNNRTAVIPARVTSVRASRIPSRGAG
jgi:hypothetical protein